MAEGQASISSSPRPRFLRHFWALLSRISGVLKQTRFHSAAFRGQLPQPPRFILEHREEYEIHCLNRVVDSTTDYPLAALYRIYEHIVLDQHLELRNEIEGFWFHNTWAVADIPDPRDSDKERYACLSCIPALLCEAFNARIELGLPRDAPSIFTRSMLTQWQAQARKYEEMPSWAAQVPRLRRRLALPHWDNSRRDFVPLESMDDPRQSDAFVAKNILLWMPHIHFA